MTGRLRIPRSQPGRRGGRGVERRLRGSSSEPRSRVHVQPVGSRRGLTWEQAALVGELLARAHRERPIWEPWRRALRLAGILSAVKGGRVGNRAWGVRMFHRRGGLARARHAPQVEARNLARGVPYRFGQRMSAAELKAVNARGQAAALRRWGADRPIRRRGI